MPYYWKDCIIEGNNSFTYMINNFDTMFDGDSIKHFYIGYATSNNMVYYRDINDMYNSEIQSPLSIWIKKEHENMKLFEETNWKLFHDQHDPYCVYMCYNKLFQYKQYYFQLAIENGCGADWCEYCKKESNGIHFELALFGWKENGILEPDKKYTVEDDNMICKKFWNTPVQFGE